MLTKRTHGGGLPFTAFCYSSRARLLGTAFTATVLGCTPDTGSQSFVVHDRIMRAEHKLLNNYGIEQSFSAQHLDALMGQPELIADVGEFKKQLWHLNRGESQRFNRIATSSLNRIQEAISENGDAATIWTHELMDSCEVWVYNWTRPDHVTLYSVGGTVLLPFSRLTTKRFSYVYVMYKAQVVACMSLEWMDSGNEMKEAQEEIRERDKGSEGDEGSREMRGREPYSQRENRGQSPIKRWGKTGTTGDSHL